jgi:hypothetical protein
MGLLLLFIATLFTAVYLFSLPALSSGWNLTNKGSVGDAINGMTAPIIGSLGVILIYISFREQVKANQLQFEALNKQRELDIVYKFYTELKEDLEEIQDLYGQRHKQPNVLDSFMNEIMNDKSKHSTYNDLHTFIKFLNDQFSFVASRLMVNQTLGEGENMSLIVKLNRLYGLYFGAYYLNIASAEFQSPLSKEFKADIKLVSSSMHNLGKYYTHLLDQMMKEALQSAKATKK